MCHPQRLLHAEFGTDESATFGGAANNNVTGNEWRRVSVLWCPNKRTKRVEKMVPNQRIEVSVCQEGLFMETSTDSFDRAYDTCTPLLTWTAEDAYRGRRYV